MTQRSGYNGLEAFDKEYNVHSRFPGLYKAVNAFVDDCEGCFALEHFEVIENAFTLEEKRFVDDFLLSLSQDDLETLCYGVDTDMKLIRDRASNPILVDKVLNMIFEGGADGTE